MKDYEESIYGAAKARPTLADLKNQRMRLKEDLAQFLSRKPNSTAIATLRVRLRDLDGEIAAAEETARRERRPPKADAPEGAADTGTVRATTGRYPSRRR